MIDAWNFRFIILVGFCILIFIVFGILLALQQRRNSQAKRFHNQNPQAAFIITPCKSRDGWIRCLSVEKVDGQRAYTFADGVSLLPGPHSLELEYSVLAPGTSRFKTQHRSTITMSLLPSTRYLLIFDDEGTNYSFVELPGEDQLSWDDLRSYLSRKTQAGEDITRNAIETELF